MKTEDWIWLGQANRRQGKTSTMAAATKLLNGTLVCMSTAEANRVAREHDCVTMAVSESVEKLRGFTLAPFLFDPSAVMQICIEARMEITAAQQAQQSAEAETKRQVAEVAKLKKKVEHLREEVRTQAREIEELEEDLEEQSVAEGFEDEFEEFAEDHEAGIEVLARLVANPSDADALRAAKDLLPAEKGGYR